MAAILIAEDDPAERDVMSYQLEQAGCRVIAVADGPAALAAAATGGVTAVVVKERLPGVSGLQLCRSLRGEARTHDLPILVLGPAGTEDEAVDAFHAGADDWLAEPVHPHEFVLRVQALLRRCDHHPLQVPVYRPRHAA
ncbi:response regulator transcription factor [Dactylosporangium sp. NPDC000521]|uniref:response regulator transcription factor n=1 Tax=Dactylosporangium sp. NPDC000521 TaxID=3363975 RepID=UPI0036BD9350